MDSALNCGTLKANGSAAVQSSVRAERENRILGPELKAKDSGSKMAGDIFQSPDGRLLELGRAGGGRADQSVE